jgi:hypothetical protein
VNVAPTVSILLAKIAARFRRAARILIQRFGIMPVPPVCDNLVSWFGGPGLQDVANPRSFVLDFPLPECVARRPRLKALFQVVTGLGYPS